MVQAKAGSCRVVLGRLRSLLSRVPCTEPGSLALASTAGPGPAAPRSGSCLRSGGRRVGEGRRCVGQAAVGSAILRALSVLAAQAQGDEGASHGLQ